MKLQKERIQYLDIARGLSIILMVMFHVIPKCLISEIVYSFHVPLFIIISGYFFKDEEPIKILLKKIVTNLLIPYAIIILLVYLIQSINSGEFNFNYLLLYTLLGNSNAKMTSIPCVGVLWFIPFLAVIKFLFWLIKRIVKKNEFCLFMLIVLISLSGIILAYNRIYLPWSADAAMACICFYYIGYIMKKYNVLDYIFKHIGIILIVFSCYIITFLFGNIDISVRTYPFGLICFITAIMGSIIIFYISKLIEKYSVLITKFLKWFGKNSIYILIFHYLEINLVDYSIFNNKVFLHLAIKLIIITILSYSYLLIKKHYKLFCSNNLAIK